MFFFVFMSSSISTSCRPTSTQSSETAAAHAAAPKLTHTNACIQDLGVLLKCQDRNALGLPRDMQGCCSGVKTLADDTCHCNPAIDAILGSEGKKIYQMEILCRLAQPRNWAKVTPFFLRKCEAAKGHKYGCEKSDVEIDAARFTSITNFQKALDNAENEKQCLDTPAFADKLAIAFAPDVEFKVPYGIGSYVGIQDVSEYLGMVFNGLTHGFWFNDITPQPTKKARLEVSKDGKTWYVGATSKGVFFRGQKPYDDNYLESEIEFKGCETKISKYTILPTESMKFVIERIVQAADLSKRWGAEDICRYHTKFCAGDPTTKQYESEKACLDYMKELPLYTKACGRNRPLSGHSISCKLKHHFMIPAHPNLHCAHIGPKGITDPNDHIKCDDEIECGSDEGQDSWPNVTEIGDRTPKDIQDLFEKDNAGYESEPFGCAIPTKDAGKVHH